MIDMANPTIKTVIIKSTSKLSAQEIRRITQPLHEQSLKETQEYFRRRFAEQKQSESPAKPK